MDLDRHRHRHSTGIWAVSLLAIALLLSGCAVQLVSDYDAQTDQSVTELQKKVETFLLSLEQQAGSPDCTYDHHRDFYTEAKVDVSAIKVRADAIPKNSITSEQIGLVGKSLDDLEQLHQLKSAKERGHNCLTVPEIEPLRSGFNTSFTSILKFELAKKRGAAQ